MVKLGKKKLAELSELSKKKSAAYSDSDENPKNGASNSGDDENGPNKESDGKPEISSKKQRASTAATKSNTHDDSNTDESDDMPLNGSKGSGPSAPPRKKQRKTPKPKARVSTTAAEKNHNKKSSSKSDEPELNEDDDNIDAEFEVEAIVGHKAKRGESYFLVRWKGYGKESDSWEPEAELNCDDLIEEYRKKDGSKKSTGIGKKSPGSAKAVRGRKPNRKVESDPDKEWAVERILDFVDDDEHGGLYRIRWKGFGAKEDTWEPESNLSCEGLIEKFKKGLDEQRNVDVKHLRESPKKTKRLVNETIPRSNLHNRIERSSKRAAAKNRVFYGEE
ncbi:M-phase phosphoprotein 8 [Drosophila novamexicana]|uniref:M-phase phosphoprotein 8 n=1 Tax=Drosophila novamexicana TaxID=47314 RepID=UPI0011E5AA43|nr:M-phase phosphoprotein 8 [Drosophila novamexicana]